MSETIQITVKVTPRMLARLDILRPFLTEETGLEATRAAVARHAISAGLRVLERRRARGEEVRDVAFTIDADPDDDDPPAPGMARAVLQRRDGSTFSVDVEIPAPNVFDRQDGYFRRVGGTVDEPFYAEGSRPEEQGERDGR